VRSTISQNPSTDERFADARALRAGARPNAFGPLDGADFVLAQIERSARVIECRPRILAESGSRMHMLDVRWRARRGGPQLRQTDVGRDTFHRAALCNRLRSHTVAPLCA